MIVCEANHAGLRSRAKGHGGHFRRCVRRGGPLLTTDDTVSFMRAKTTYSITEAATATGKGRATIRRYLDAGRFPNAFQEDTADPFPAWRIPSGDLLACGLTLGAPPLAPKEGSKARRVDEVDLGAREALAAATAVAEERARTIEALTIELAETRRALIEALATMRALAEPKEPS